MFISLNSAEIWLLTIENKFKVTHAYVDTYGM